MSSTLSAILLIGGLVLLGLERNSEWLIALVALTKIQVLGEKEGELQKLP